MSTRIGAILATLLLSSVTSQVISFDRYVPVVGGYVWSSCAHSVPQGSHISRTEKGIHVVHPDETIVTIPKCSKPFISNKDVKRQAEAGIDAEGWQTFAQYVNPTNGTFDSFLGDFSVPKEPTKWTTAATGVLFFFPSLMFETSDPEDIIQPVLQYGVSAAGGGKYWAMACWYVTSDGSAVYSPLAKVTTGDVIFGNMTLTGKDTYFIGADVKGSSKINNITVTKPDLKVQTWAAIAVEVYSITDCAWFPASDVIYTDLSLTADNFKPVKPTWTQGTGEDNPCNVGLTIKDATQVSFQFKN